MQLSIGPLKKTLVNALHRYHVVIFVVVILGGLGYSIFALSAIVNQSPPTTTSTSNANGSFDTATIERIKKLKTSDQPSAPLDTSRGRVDPFVE